MMDNNYDEESVFHLPEDLKAWNVDGSGSDKLFYKSWIQFWEDTTGNKREEHKCSYSDCHRPSTVGGHIWIARFGVVIAPICTGCNNAQNPNRLQGSHACLRKGTIVVETEYTEAMATATRYIAVRTCTCCGEGLPRNIPASHTLCLECFYQKRQCVDCGMDIFTRRQDSHSRCLRCHREEQRRRRCADCGQDISDRPPSHSQCLRCYRQTQFIRRCKDCGQDISDRPSSHTQCLQCYRQVNRRCEDCGEDIADRPENHSVCLRCFRRKKSRQGHYY